MTSTTLVEQPYGELKFGLGVKVEVERGFVPSRFRGIAGVTVRLAVVVGQMAEEWRQQEYRQCRWWEAPGGRWRWRGCRTKNPTS